MKKKIIKKQKSSLTLNDLERIEQILEKREINPINKKNFDRILKALSSVSLPKKNK